MFCIKALGGERLSYLMAVVHSGYYLSEEVPRLPFRDVPLVTDVVVQVPLAGVLHHNHNFVLVFKY